MKGHQLLSKDIREILTRLTTDHGIRDLALFNLGTDSSLRGCDLVKLRQNITVEDSTASAGASATCRFWDDANN